MRELSEHDKQLIVGGVPESDLALFCPGLQGHDAALLDRSQYANHGTFVSASWTRVPGGQRAVSINGAGSYVLIPHHASLVLTNRVATFSVWIKPGTQTADYPQVFSKYTNDSSNGYSLSMPADMGTLYWQMFDGVENKYVVSSVALTPGVWQHLVCRKTATKLEFYRNGTPAGDETYTVEPHDNGANLLLGAMYAGANVIRNFVGELSMPYFVWSLKTPSAIYQRQRHLFHV